MAGHNLLGLTLTEAQKSLDLFTWFFFTKVDETPSENGALVFRPNGPAFRRLVKLELTLAPDGTITAASLHVRRSFIQSNSANAGDLVKSFIRYGNDPSVDELSQEIMMRALGRSSQPVIMRGGVPEPSGPPSLAFRVFSGEGVPLTLGNLTFENRGKEGENNFVLSLAPVAKSKGWFARVFGGLSR